MTMKLSRERALTAALDHLHTGATALARFASKTSTRSDVAIEVPPTSAPAAAFRRPRLNTRRQQAVAAVGALVLATAATVTLARTSAQADPVAAPNSVVSYGAAPRIAPEFGSTLRAGVIGIAGNPAGGGYWLVASDGGVFSFGDAEYHGSTGAESLAAPIVAIVPTRDGGGYWLVAADGGVFSYGNARFHGSAVRLELASPIVGAAASQGGHGYWLLGADGGVFAFGDAPFQGAPLDVSPAVGIAAAPGTEGYWVAHADGSVRSFGGAMAGNAPMIDGAPTHPNTVGIAASARPGYWLAQGVADERPSLADDPFLKCTRAHESDQAGGYAAVSPGGTYRGAYQFDRGTWNSASQLAGRADLVGADPATVAPADQDLVAMALFQVRGHQPWGGRCQGLS